MDDQEIAAAWNDFAPDYVANLRADRTTVVADAVAALQAQKLLDSQVSLADVGGGEGRFARAFAPIVKLVTLFDISREIIKFAEVSGQNFRNIDYQVCSWRFLRDKTTPIADIVFISMLPGLSVADLTDLNHLARRRVILLWATGETDSLFDDLALKLHQPDLAVTLRQPEIIADFQQALQQRAIAFQQWEKTYTFTEKLDRTLIAAGLSDDLDSTQQQQLQAWLASQPEHLITQQTRTYSWLSWSTQDA